MSEKRRLLAVNYAFYAAFRFADLEAMDALWSRSRDVALFHPNVLEKYGRKAVMDFWRQIMTEGSPPDVRPKNAIVVTKGKVALVICTEDCGDSQMIATNVFVKDRDGWRMTQHQASRLPAMAESGA